MKLTLEDVFEAPMFTVWKDMRGKVACQDVNTDWWDLFEGANISEDVWDTAAGMGINLVGELLSPMRDDDHVHGLDAEERFCDADASMCALEHGLTLVKLPDELSSPYWRLYVVEPLLDPWKKRKEEACEDTQPSMPSLPASKS